MISIRKLLFGAPSADKIAGKITWRIARSSHEIFCNSKTHLYLDFDNLTQIERDRIFNEFAVSAQALVILTLETLIYIYNDGDLRKLRDFVWALKEKLFASYSDILAELGVEKKYTDLWQKLIKMRVEEYRKEWSDNRAALPDIRRFNPWIRVVAVGAEFHIRRGKVDNHDPLFLVICEWIGDTSAETLSILASALKRL